MYQKIIPAAQNLSGGILTRFLGRSLPAKSHFRLVVCGGFTLIELLVVVLIIGILAAIALPQYELAVEKSRSAEPLIVLKALREAQEVYFLANGSYADDLSKLDVQVDLDNPNWRYGTEAMSVYAYRQNVDNSRKYLFAFRFSEGRKNGMASIVCRNDGMAYGSEAFAARICKSLGGQEIDGEKWVLEK